MDAETIQDPKTLLAQLAQEQEKLERLAGELRAVDGELEALSTERQQFRLLADACGALEQLSELGAAELFWGDRAAVGSGEQQMRRVRGLVAGFEISVTTRSGIASAGSGSKIGISTYGSTSAISSTIATCVQACLR